VNSITISGAKEQCRPPVMLPIQTNKALDLPLLWH
jgi:hypothetical protein